MLCTLGTYDPVLTDKKTSLHKHKMGARDSTLGYLISTRLLSWLFGTKRYMGKSVTNISNTDFAILICLQINTVNLWKAKNNWEFLWAKTQIITYQFLLKGKYFVHIILNLFEYIHLFDYILSY